MQKSWAIAFIVGTSLLEIPSAAEDLRPVPDMRFSRPTAPGAGEVADSQNTGVLVAPESRLTADELRKASHGESILDAAVSLLNDEPVSADPVGTAVSPALKFTERLDMAGRQFAFDMQHLANLGVGRLLDNVASMANGQRPPLEDAARINSNDDRVTVSNTTATPFKSICSIEATWPNGSKTSNTAAFVGPRVLITSAIAIHDKSRGGWASNVWVVPGRNGSSQPFGAQYAAGFNVPNEWVSTGFGNTDFNIGWIRMPTDKVLWNRVGYAFGYETMSDSSLASVLFNFGGYHSDKNFTMSTQYGAGRQTPFASRFKHVFDTVGAKGSPFWRFTGTGSTGQRYIGGVHSFNDVDTLSACNPRLDPDCKANAATRMTSRYFNTTKDLVTKNP